MNRNKTILFAQACCLVALLSGGSVAVAQKAVWGVRAGLNYATMQYTGFIVEEAFAPRFSAGVFAEIPLRGKLGLTAALGYSGKGGGVKGTISGSQPIPYDGKVRLDYLQFSPALAYLGRRFYVGAGPYVAYCLGGQYTTNALGIREIRDAAIGTTQFDDIQPADWGLHAEVALRLRRWRVGLSFAYGMANVVPTRQGFSETPGIRLLAAQVGVGYVVGRGEKGE